MTMVFVYYVQSMSRYKPKMDAEDVEYVTNKSVTKDKLYQWSQHEGN